MKVFETRFPGSIYFVFFNESFNANNKLVVGAHVLHKNLNLQIGESANYLKMSIRKIVR